MQNGESLSGIRCTLPCPSLTPLLLLTRSERCEWTHSETSHPDWRIKRSDGVAAPHALDKSAPLGLAHASRCRALLEAHAASVRSTSEEAEKAIDAMRAFSGRSLVDLIGLVADHLSLVSPLIL